MRHYAKEISKLFGIMTMAFGLIIAILLIKYKPTYKVTILGEDIGYVSSKKAIEETIQSSILNQEGDNIDTVSLNAEPTYEFKLINRNETTNEEEVIEQISDNATVTYKYYQVALNDQTSAVVNSLEEAEDVVNQIKDEYSEEEGLELNLQIIEQYTENMEEVSVDSTEVAKTAFEENLNIIVEENSLPTVNGIKLAVSPVSGTLTSRFGERSSIRSSTHTGLDIACSTGTAIKVVADGTVTFAERNGAYGYLVKVDHGNGVETWYAHCSKIYTKVGTQVTAGDVIAAVGSTGNSTGPHLHLEIRIDGTPINPQTYLYN